MLAIKAELGLEPRVIQSPLHAASQRASALVSFPNRHLPHLSPEFVIYPMSLTIVPAHCLVPLARKVGTTGSKSLPYSLGILLREPRS